MTLIRIIFILLSFCYASRATAQDVSPMQLDSLEYEELLTLFAEVQKDSINAEKVARAYLNRARKEGDTIKMARGYDRLARIFHPTKNIAFADSLIELTKNIENITYPGMGYILKAHHYSFIDNLVLETENIHKTFHLAKNNNNLAQELYALHIIIMNKSYWGDKKEALELQKYRHTLLMKDSLHLDLTNSSRKEFKSKVNLLIEENMILSYYSFAFCHINLRDFDEASRFLKKAKDLNNNYLGSKNQRYSNMLLSLALETEFHLKNYSNVLKLQIQLLESNEFDQSHNQNSLFDMYGFIGLTYVMLDRKADAIKNLKKADSIYEEYKLPLMPYQRRFISKLLDYSIEFENSDDQITYYKKLKQIDSVFKINYKYFESEVTDRIEVPLLLSERDSKISSLEEKQKTSRKFINWLWSGIGVFLVVIFFLVRKHLLYKKRVQALIQQPNDARLELRTAMESESMGGLTSEIVKDIMDKLERFEQAQKYRNTEINLHKLAKRFNTNARYLSKVVNFKKERNFSQYLNELRVNYSVDALRNDPNYRKYTIKAIAELSGFSSAESYSRAFKRKFGIHPSYFIRELLKSKESESIGKTSTNNENDQ